MIILLAIGNERYGQWAYNLALSIKHFGTIPIQLVYEKKTVKKLKDLTVFDVRTEIDREDCYDGHLFDPARAKLTLNKYLAFDSAYYFDVDAVCIKDIREMKMRKFYCSEVIGSGTFDQQSFGDNMYWASPETILKHYPELKDKRFDFINSSFQYIQKGVELDALYSQAYDNLTNRPIPKKELKEYWGKKGTGQPDELYMNIALCQLGIDARCHEKPVYFNMKTDAPLTFGEIKKNHYMIGYYGGKETAHRLIKQMYDKLMRRYTSDAKRNHLFQFDQLIDRKYMTL